MPKRVLGIVALVVHCTYVALHYLLTGLVAPVVAVPFMLAAWVGFLALGVWLLRRGNWGVLAVPAAAMGLWWGVLAVGESVWGWTA